MAGTKGNSGRKKGSKYPCKKNTVLSSADGRKVEKKADEKSTSESSIIRQCVEYSIDKIK